MSQRPVLILKRASRLASTPQARLRDQGATIVVSSHILPDLEDFSTSIGVMERGVMLRSGE